jgi:hypothetical protein
VLGFAAADLLEQVGIFTVPHRSADHGIKPAVEAPARLVEHPSDREVSLGGVFRLRCEHRR